MRLLEVQSRQRYPSRQVDLNVTQCNITVLLGLKLPLTSVCISVLFPLHNKLSRSGIWCNPFAFFRVGTACSDHDALRSDGINSAVQFKSWPFQGSVLRELFLLSRPSHLPWWWLTSSAFPRCMPIAQSVADFSHNLIFRDEVMTMQWEYITIFAS